jgi:hypothetical protein
MTIILTNIIATEGRVATNCDVLISARNMKLEERGRKGRTLDRASRGGLDSGEERLIGIPMNQWDDAISASREGVCLAEHSRV